MTPFARLLLLGVIAILIAVLLVRVVVRWWQERRAQRASTGTPYRIVPGQTASSAVHSTATDPAPEQADRPVRADNPALPPRESSAGPAAFAASSSWSTPATAAPMQRFDSEDMPFADKSDYSFGPITPMLAVMLPEAPEKKQRLKRFLKNAGYYTPHAWQNLAATRYLGIVLPILLFGTLLILVPSHLEWPVMAALIAVPILGYSLPGLLVQSQATARLRDIEQGMPDMLDMLNMCVSQGMTLPAALHRVGLELRGVYPDLAKELSIVGDQARIAGLPQALTSLADRIDTPEVQTFASLLIQTEQMGTSVSNALADYSENIRQSQRQRADQKANSATFKLLFPTVLCLMPAIFLFLLGPAIVQLHDFYSRGGTDLIRGDANAILQQDQP